MDLFTPMGEPYMDLLPRDGVAHYYGPIMERKEADRYFQALFGSIAWDHDVVQLFGKRIVTKRKVAWYGDRPFGYTYSNHTRTALPWTEELLALKTSIETLSGERFNSCLLNRYHHGGEGMGWHSDAERELKRDGAIASLSLGAQRIFSFKHKKGGERIKLALEHGSLLIMKGPTQRHWLHSLPPTKGVDSPRINLTFRTIETD